MTRFVRNRIIVAVAAAWFLYWPVAYFTPRSITIELISGLIAALGVGIVIAYAPAVWWVLRDRPYKLSGAHLLVLGVTLLQTAIVGLFAWSWAYRVLDRPAWMVDHMIRGWIIYLLFIAGILHLIAGDLEHEAMPTRAWLRLGSFVSLGLGLGVLAIMFVGNAS